MVQAFAAEAKLTLAHVAVEGKSNEIPAWPRRLELPDVQDRMVAADTMQAPRATAAVVAAATR